MHSTTERVIKRAGNVSIPTVLTMIIRLARKVPHKVTEAQQPVIKDWKQYRQQLRILRISKSDEGAPVDWTKVM